MESEAAVFQHQFFPDPLQQNPLSSAAAAERRGSSDWDVKAWNWDSLLFLAQPNSSSSSSYQQHLHHLHQQQQQHQHQQQQVHLQLQLQQEQEIQRHQQQQGGGCKRGFDMDGTNTSYKAADSPPASKVADSGDDEDAECLTLKLGGHSYSSAEAATASKRQRSSSPQQQQQQQQQYPMCQVDDCKADLTTAKDYHRRHKVCEMHSKAAKAQVGRLMQRFCQQCSRFHPLQEFDEGKRSCRRRLAGHNRRRRKTQPDAAAAQAYLFAEDDVALKSAGVLRLLHVLSQIQAANNYEKATALHERDLALEFLKRATSVSPALGDLSSPKLEGKPLNLDVLKGNGLLSPEALAAVPLLEAVSFLLKGPAVQPTKDVSQQHLMVQQALYNGNGHHAQSFPRQVGADHHRRQTEDCSVVEVLPNGAQVPSNVRKLFPLPGSCEGLGTSVSKPVDVDRPSLMGILGSADRPTVVSRPTASVAAAATAAPLPPQSVHSQQSSESQSGSDQSPESSYADLQERTGRISFKLFDRNPGEFPQVLRSQIVEWLSHVPSDMESYIRPGCVVLAVYLSMPGSAWKNLCRDFLGSLRRLLTTSNSDFWLKGRILVQVEDELAYIVDGKVQPVFPKSRNSPRIISVRPLAMVMGQKANLVLEGYSIAGPDTRVYSAYQDKYDFLPCEARVEGERVQTLSFMYGPHETTGRSLVEVETDAGTNFVPVIVADDAVCKELNDLEYEADRAWNKVEEWCSTLEGDCYEFMEAVKMAVEHEADRFLQELGWFLQRKRWKLKATQYPDMVQQYCQLESGMLKRLFLFALERNWSAVSRLLLDTVFILKEGRRDEAMAVLESIHLLHKAVARNRPKIVELLLSYKPATVGNTSTSVLFSPDCRGLAGLTPLHVAACIKDGEAVITALTNSQVGLSAWNTVQDSGGQTPFDNAIQCGNLSYIQLVWNKMATGNFRPSPSQVIVDIPSSLADKEPSALELALWTAASNSTTVPKKQQQQQQQQQQACSLEVAARRRQMAGIRGPMYKPFMLSMVAIAAVCVCVCLLFKGPPQVRFVLSPFTWDKVRFGPR